MLMWDSICLWYLALHVSAFSKHQCIPALAVSQPTDVRPCDLYIDWVLPCCASKYSSGLALSMERVLQQGTKGAWLVTSQDL